MCRLWWRMTSITVSIVVTSDICNYVDCGDVYNCVDFGDIWRLHMCWWSAVVSQIFVVTSHCQKLQLQRIDRMIKVTVTWYVNVGRVGLKAEDTNRWWLTMVRHSSVTFYVECCYQWIIYLQMTAMNVTKNNLIYKQWSIWKFGVNRMIR